MTAIYRFRDYAADIAIILGCGLGLLIDETTVEQIVRDGCFKKRAIEINRPYLC